MPPITREYAYSLFADLTQSAVVPLDPDELLHMPGLRWHGHVFFGDIAVRCYKHKTRWTYAERDIRAVGQTFAELDLDLGDVVDVQLPAYRDRAERDPEDWHRPNWRRQLVSWMFDRAYFKLHRAERPYEERGDWRTIGPNGLPGGLSWEEFVASSGSRRQNIAGTRPLQLLTWSGGTWRLPRAYADILDRWEQREDELVTRARLCSSCGEQGPYSSDWRTSTTAGYVTRCPPCSGEAFQPYTGHLRGVQYESARRRSTRADDYLCRLCKVRQASAWDHCHDHGHVRGPLCGRCNTHEAKAVPHDFLQRQGATLHLLECRGCLEQRTLPSRFHPGVVRAHLEQTERHGRCRQQPYAHEVEHAHGVYRFQLRCSAWHTNGIWTKDVTATGMLALVQAFVDATLIQENPPAPDPGLAE